MAKRIPKTEEVDPIKKAEAEREKTIAAKKEEARLAAETAQVPEAQPAAEPQGEDQADKVKFRFNKKSYFMPIGPTKITQTISGRNREDLGLAIKAENFRATFDPGDPEDAIRIRALRESPRLGLDFEEIKQDNSNVEKEAFVLNYLTKLDPSAVRMQFTNEELKSVQLGDNATHAELIAAFIKLKKELHIPQLVSK